MFTYIYIYIHTYMHINIFIHMFIYKYTYVYIHMYLGQSGIGSDFKTWKSDEEMKQRQQYD
jgi:hypothetical protein